MHRPPKDAHLDSDARPERTANNVLAALAHAAQAVEDAEERRARRGPVAPVDVVARAEVVWRERDRLDAGHRLTGLP